MPRLFIYINDNLDKRLRDYIHRRFKGHVHGKISEVIREALEQFLEREELVYGET